MRPAASHQSGTWPKGPPRSWGASARLSTRTGLPRRVAARTRQTAASLGPSTTCWSTAGASRWPSSCRRPTFTTLSCWSRSWTPSRRSRAGRGGSASDRSSCTVTRARLPALSAGAAAAWHHAQDRPAGIESSERLGRHRYVVERSLAWLLGYRRLQVRYERRADILVGFLSLPCALLCLKALTPSTGTVALGDRPVRLPPLRNSNAADRRNDRAVRVLLGAFRRRRASTLPGLGDASGLMQQCPLG
jgi:hypothetical protein